jgi:malonyl CoA-acyl carrier protein transacylase
MQERIGRTKMVAFVFPGQGSQKKGMGRELFDDVPEYRAVEREVDAVVGYSMRQLCIEDTGNQLKDTRFTQPALYVVNALHYFKAIRQGQRPNFLAGHSLGEYNALLAAGAFDFITGLRLVKKRGELMAQATNGGMAAVIGLSPARIEQVIREQGLSSIDVANFNSPTQTVLSGPTIDIKRAAASFEAAGARMYMPLQVSAAFHSRYMAESARQFADFLAPIPFKSLQTPVIANVTGRPYPVGAHESIKATLVQQIAQSVLWTQSVRYLLEQGAGPFVEIGPGNVLTRLVQEIQQAAAAAAPVRVAAVVH